MEHIFILTDFVFWSKTKTHGLFLPLRTTMRISPCHVPLLSGGLLAHGPHLRIRREQGLAYRPAREPFRWRGEGGPVSQFFYRLHHLCTGSMVLYWYQSDFFRSFFASGVVFLRKAPIGIILLAWVYLFPPSDNSVARMGAPHAF